MSAATFKAKLDNAYGNFESLVGKLYTSKANVDKNRENWPKIIEEFSARLQEWLELEKDFEKLQDPTLLEVFQEFQGVTTPILRRMILNSGDLSERPIIINTKKPQVRPLLHTRILKQIYDHKGKIAFATSMLIIAGHTSAGSKLFTTAGTWIVNSAEYLYEPVKNMAIKSAQFVSGHLASIGTVLSAVWAIPAAYRAGFNKKGAAILLVGAVSAAAPHVLKPDFTWQGAWAKAKELGATIIAMTTWCFQKT